MAINLPKDVLARHPEWGFIPPNQSPFVEPKMGPIDSPQLYQDDMLNNMKFWGATSEPNMAPRNAAGQDLDMRNAQDSLTFAGQQDAPDTNPNMGHYTPLPNWNPNTPNAPAEQGYNYHRSDSGQGYPVPFDQGGTVSIGNFDPNDPATVDAVRNGSITYNPAQYGDNNVTALPSTQFLNTPNPVGTYVPPANAAPPPANYGPPTPMSSTVQPAATAQPFVLPGAQSGQPAAQWQAQGNATMATSAFLDSQRNALAFQPQVTAADSNVLNAQGANIQANRAYLDEQLRASQMQQQAQQKIQAAKSNTADIIAVGREQNLRNNSDSLYSLAGLKAPVDLQLPADYKGELPPGTRMKLQTLADWLSEKASDADTMEKFNVEAARIHAANTGQDVTAAQVAAGRVHLTLDELDNAAKAAGLNAQSAALQVQASKQPPAPGLVWNQYKNSWTSAEQEQYDGKMYGGQLNNANNTPLGGIPAGTLVQMYTSGVIADPEQLRQGLVDGGMDPSAANYYVAQAQYDKDNASKSGGSLAAILKILGG